MREEGRTHLLVRLLAHLLLPVLGRVHGLVGVRLRAVVPGQAPVGDLDLLVQPGLEVVLARQLAVVVAAERRVLERAAEAGGRARRADLAGAAADERATHAEVEHVDLGVLVDVLAPDGEVARLQIVREAVGGCPP